MLKNSISKEPRPVNFAKPMLIGAGIAFILISLFVFDVNNPDPAWGKFWMVRPLLVTPLAGALGGAFYAFLDYETFKGFNRTLAVLLSLVVYITGLWLGTVLGLVGTLWN